MYAHKLIKELLRDKIIKIYGFAVTSTVLKDST